MPRMSAEARATATAASQGKLEPSTHLSAAQRKVWRELVAATPAGHLSERDRPLVENFVVLSVAQRRLHKDIGGADAAHLLEGNAADALKRLESIAKTLAALSNRLKLAPLAQHSAPHRARQRDEQPTVAPLLGGLARIK